MRNSPILVRCMLKHGFGVGCLLGGSHCEGNGVVAKRLVRMYLTQATAKELQISVATEIFDFFLV